MKRLLLVSMFALGLSAQTSASDVMLVVKSSYACGFADGAIKVLKQEGNASGAKAMEDFIGHTCDAVRSVAGER